MNTPRLSKFKLDVVLHISAAVVVASCASLACAQEVKPTAAPTIGADGSVTMVIRKGHNVREIAKKYSRAHNVPFNTTLAGLLAANPNAFIKNDPDVLIIGAPFVLPNRVQLLGLESSNAVNAAQVDGSSMPLAAAPDDKKASEAVSVPATQAVPAPASTVTSATNAPLPPPVVTAGVAAGDKPNVDSAFPMPIWAMCLIAIALLMLGVRIFRRSTPEPLLDVDEDKDQQSSVLNPPTVHVDLTKKESSISSPHEHDALDDSVQAIGVDQNAPVADLMNKDHANVRVNDFERIKFESDLLEDPQITFVQRDPTQGSLVSRPSTATTQPTFAGNTFGRVDIEAIAADVHAESVDVVDASDTVETQVVESMPVAPQKMEDTSTKNKSIAPLSKGLDLDVSGFMKHYANQIPPMRVQPSLDFEDLLDRANLQSWLNQNTPEDVLLHAQDAHEERYGEVAEAMLADVLFRGDAEQCAMAVRLRKEWSTPRPL